MSEINDEKEKEYVNKLIKIKTDLNNFHQSLGNPKYEAAKKKMNFELDAIDKIIKSISNIEKRKRPKKKTLEEFYNGVVNYYNRDVKKNLDATIENEPEGAGKNILKEIYELLPDIQNKFINMSSDSEPIENEQQELNKSLSTHEDLIKKVSPMLKQGALHEKLTPPDVENITRPNPDAPPVTEVSTTPIDDFIEPKQEPDEEEEKEEKENEEPEEEEEEQSPEKNYEIVKRDIYELANNPELDIVRGVGDVIEFMATQKLDDEMTDDLIDKMLTLKDSHGNLLFNNRFQIEDLIRNRKKRRRLKYLLPKRIIRAEKPDEQKLIINPMLRRGRIASMTSAKTRYYYYI